MNQTLRRDAELRRANANARMIAHSGASRGGNATRNNNNNNCNEITTTPMSQQSQSQLYDYYSPPYQPPQHDSPTATTNVTGTLSQHNHNNTSSTTPYMKNNYNNHTRHQYHSPPPPSQQQQPPQQQNQMMEKDDTTTDDGKSSVVEDMARTARNEWQQYGNIKTQSLEDLRHGRRYNNNNNNNNHNNNNTMNDTWKIGKVVRAEERIDITGASYTTYIIHIWDRCSTTTTITNTNTTSGSFCSHNRGNLSSMLVMERRYSDFCKLYQSLCGSPATGSISNRSSSSSSSNTDYLSYDDWYQNIRQIFPNKHWAGRMGNWTPAKYIAPQHYQQVITERIQLFDAWFVYVLYAYNIYPNQIRQQLQYTFLSEQQNTMIHDYITNPSPPTPYMIRTTPPPLTTVTATTSSPYINSMNMDTNVADGTTTTTASYSILQYHNPVTFTLSSALRQATTTIQIMTQQMLQQEQTQSPHSSYTTNNKNVTSTTTPTTLPIDLLQMATGIVFLTVAKIGMIVSGRVGTGVFIAKRRFPSLTTTTTTSGFGNQPIRQQQQQQQYHPWSAPVAVGTIGLGWGAVIGGDVTHYMIVFTTDDAVRDFARNHTVQLGTEFGFAIGPTGLAASQQIQSKSKEYLQYHSTYAYAISSGLFLGVTLEGSMISIRHDVNAKFYGQSNISVSELLQLPGVPAAEPLYDALDIAIRQEIPEHAIFKFSRYIQSDDDDK